MKKEIKSLTAQLGELLEGKDKDINWELAEAVTRRLHRMVNYLTYHHKTKGKVLRKLPPEFLSLAERKAMKSQKKYRHVWLGDDVYDQPLDLDI
jgi:hypothetical protein